MAERDLVGRHILITGANTGIGRATAQALATRGATLLLAGRSAEKTAPVVEELKGLAGHDNVLFYPLDLGDLASVRACATAILDSGAPIHVLIANAGLAGMRGVTTSGFELAFGVNHVGHALFVRLLLDRIKASAPARIVMVSSKAHYRAKGIDYAAIRETTKATTGMPEYEVSKLANIYFARALTTRLDGSGVTTYSLHPGVIASDIWRRVPWPIRKIMTLFMGSTEDGAKTSIYCAVDPACAEESGLYYDGCKAYKPSEVARDDAAAEKLWSETAGWIGLPV